MTRPGRVLAFGGDLMLGRTAARHIAGHVPSAVTMCCDDLRALGRDLMVACRRRRA